MLSVKTSKILLSISVTLAAIFVIISIYIFTKEKKYTEKTKATILVANCEDVLDNNRKKTGKKYCEVNIKYQIPGKEKLSSNLLKITSSIDYKKEKEITIYYNKKYPSLISKDGDTNTWAYILITVSIFIVLISYMMLRKAKNFEEFYKNI
jgi:hypothetical protein